MQKTPVKWAFLNGCAPDYRNKTPKNREKPFKTAVFALLYIGEFPVICHESWYRRANVIPGMPCL
jgi:hypothetical protein